MLVVGIRGHFQHKNIKTIMSSKIEAKDAASVLRAYAEVEKASAGQARRLSVRRTQPPSAA